MNLHDIYQDGGFSALRDLGKKVGADPQYLWQCATGWSGNRAAPRRPSPKLAARLIKADPRLTWEDLYADVDTAE